MESQDERYLILEQYRIYSDAKEKFIDRQFSTNKFYLVINIIILITAYILASFTPQYHPILILSIIGIAVTFMWLMSIDTYQTLIRVKYAKVLEYMETKLPEQPYHKEFEEHSSLKKSKKLIVFGDMQKLLTWAILLVYVTACTVSVYNIFTLLTINFIPV